MAPGTVRLWAIEHLVIWPNRLHVLVAGLLTLILIPAFFTGAFDWFGVLSVATIDGSLVLRVWVWDRRRLRDANTPAV